MKYLHKIFNISLISLILIGDLIYIISDSLIAKSITSILFVTLGIVNICYALKRNNPNKKFIWLMLCGLTFAMLGDIFLEIMFIAGAALFAIGHIFYFIAYSTLQKINLNDLFLSLCIFIPSLAIILFVPLFDFGGLLMQCVCIIYALIISCMVGKSISNLSQNKNRLNIIIAIGSCLFFISDFMLLFNVFANLHIIFGILCLSTYYPAEILLAYSINHS